MSLSLIKFVHESFSGCAVPTAFPTTRKPLPDRPVSSFLFEETLSTAFKPTFTLYVVLLSPLAHAISRPEVAISDGANAWLPLVQQFLDHSDCIQSTFQTETLAVAALLVQ
jgi:hypothetical protein